MSIQYQLETSCKRELPGVKFDTGRRSRGFSERATRSSLWLHKTIQSRTIKGISRKRWVQPEVTRQKSVCSSLEKASQRTKVIRGVGGNRAQWGSGTNFLRHLWSRIIPSSFFYPFPYFKYTVLCRRLNRNPICGRPRLHRLPPCSRQKGLCILYETGHTRENAF